MASTCKYCDNPATRTLTWLLDRQGKPARIEVPWCGCDLMTAMKKYWPNPYQVIEGQDYEWEVLNGYRLPVFLVETFIADGLPSERTYSTHGGTRIIGHIISPHPLRRDHQGCEGVFYNSPDPKVHGFYSIQSILRWAVNKEHGLNWRMK